MRVSKWEGICMRECVRVWGGWLLKAQGVGQQVDPVISQKSEGKSM